MAEAAMAPAVPAVDGLYLVGEFLGFREKRPRQVGDRTFVDVDLGLRLDGGPVETIQYGSMAEAQAAAAGAAVGDRIAVPCVNQHGAKDGRPWQFYSGVRSGTSSAFAGEFRG